MSLTKVSYSMINGEIANVLDFGAVGDGVNATANDIAFALAMASGATYVRVPKGTYVFSAPIVKPTGVCLIGDGVNATFISAKHNGNIIEIGSGVPAASLEGDSYRSLARLTITNFAGFNSAIGIRVVNITNPQFVNINVVDGPVIGIRMQAVLNGVFNEVMTRNCSDVGLYMQSTTMANGNYRNVFSNYHSYYDRIGVVLDMANSFENYFNSCAVEGSLEFPIEIINASKLVFNMLYLEGNGTSVAGGKASIKLRGGDNIVFQDCLEISNIALFETAPAATNVYVQNYYNANNNNAITQWPGLMNFQQGKIQFPSVSVPSTQPNTLDDYEEGVWTPTDASGAALTLTTGVCRYTKIGRVVQCNFNITYPTTSNDAFCLIGSLPFISKGFHAVSIAFTTVASVVKGMTSADEFYFILYNSTNGRPINSDLSGTIIRGTIVYETNV
jgi:hypothetical protein